MRHVAVIKLKYATGNVNIYIFYFNLDVDNNNGNGDKTKKKIANGNNQRPYGNGWSNFSLQSITYQSDLESDQYIFVQSLSFYLMLKLVVLSCKLKIHRCIY